MNKPLKILIYSIIALFVIGLILSLSFFKAPKASSSGKEVSYSLSAVNLYKEFDEKEAISSKKYSGKLIQVEGIIQEITLDEKKSKVILLTTGEDTMGGILCTLEKSQKHDLSELEVGERVSIKGICAGMLMDVVMNRCVILN